jgi:hypothetical protein
MSGGLSIRGRKISDALLQAPQVHIHKRQKRLNGGAAPTGKPQRHFSSTIIVRGCASMAREQHLAIEGSIAALDHLKLDGAEGFERVVVGDEETSKCVTVFIQEGCISQKLQHPRHCCSGRLHLHTQNDCINAVPYNA